MEMKFRSTRRPVGGETRRWRLGTAKIVAGAHEGAQRIESESFEDDGNRTNCAR
jgi:hypothetical protein